MVFRDLADCRAQCLRAGREWDLSWKRLSAQEVAWLADMLADPLVWFISDPHCVMLRCVIRVAWLLPFERVCRKGVLVSCFRNSPDQHDAHLAEPGIQRHWPGLERHW